MVACCEIPLDVGVCVHFRHQALRNFYGNNEYDHPTNHQSFADMNCGVARRLQTKEIIKKKTVERELELLAVRGGRS